MCYQSCVRDHVRVIGRTTYRVPNPSEPVCITMHDQLNLFQTGPILHSGTHTRPPNSLAFTVTTHDPMVTREMTMEKTWMDWLAGDCASVM